MRPSRVTPVDRKQAVNGDSTSLWAGTPVPPRGAVDSPDRTRSEEARPFPAEAMPVERFSRRTYLVLLLCFAFLLRFEATAALRDLHRFHGSKVAGADAAEFNAIALNLASGHGYAIDPGHPTAFRAPGWPLLLSAIYRISFGNYFLAYVALSLTGAMTCVLTYAAAREMLSERGARAAGALAAVYVPHIYFSTVFLSEALFALCVALGLWLMLRALRTGSVGLVFGAGIAIGYAALTRPMALLLPACCVPALFRPPATRRLAGAVALACGLALAVLPWSIRNYTVFHRPILIATNGGSTFYGSNNDTVLNDPQYLGSWVSTISLPGGAPEDPAAEEPSHDQVEWALGKNWVRSHWREIPKLLAY